MASLQEWNQFACAAQHPRAMQSNRHTQTRHIAIKFTADVHCVRALHSFPLFFTCLPLPLVSHVFRVSGCMCVGAGRSHHCSSSTPTNHLWSSHTHLLQDESRLIPPLCASLSVYLLWYSALALEANSFLWSSVYTRTFFPALSNLYLHLPHPLNYTSIHYWIWTLSILYPRCQLL